MGLLSFELVSPSLQPARTFAIGGPHRIRISAIPLSPPYPHTPLENATALNLTVTRIQSSPSTNGVRPWALTSSTPVPDGPLISPIQGHTHTYAHTDTPGGTNTTMWDNGRVDTHGGKKKPLFVRLKNYGRGLSEKGNQSYLAPIGFTLERRTLEQLEKKVLEPCNNPQLAFPPASRSPRVNDCQLTQRPGCYRRPGVTDHRRHFPPQHSVTVLVLPFFGEIGFQLGRSNLVHEY